MENEYLVRGVPGRLIPHPSGKAERWLGFREARSGEDPQHSIQANPVGGPMWQAPGQGSVAKQISPPHKAGTKRKDPVFAHTYPGRNIHLVPYWERVLMTPQTRIIVPKAIQSGDLHGRDTHDRELHDQSIAAQHAAGVAAVAAMKTTTTEGAEAGQAAAGST